MQKDHNRLMGTLHVPKSLDELLLCHDRRAHARSWERLAIAAILSEALQSGLVNYDPTAM